MYRLGPRLSQRPSNQIASERFPALNDEGRASFERPRLLSDSQQLQEAGRLPHDMFSPYGKSLPAFLTRVSTSFRWSRRVNDYQRQLERFYVEARRELGLQHPDRVFSEPST